MVKWFIILDYNNTLDKLFGYKETPDFDLLFQKDEKELISIHDYDSIQQEFKLGFIPIDSSDVGPRPCDKRNNTEFMLTMTTGKSGKYL